jgi:hypothetical protein
MKEERPISKRQPLRVPNGHHRRGTGATIGESHEGPLITRKNPFFFAKMIIQTHKPQITPRIVAAWCGEGPTARITSATHQAANLGPPRANFRLARGPGTAPRNLRLARGLDAPSGESPPRSRTPRAHDPRTHSPDRSIKCTGTTREPGSKANPRHADPLTPPGNHIPALFRQPSPCGHPWHCRGVVREGRCQLRDTVSPTPVRPARRSRRKRAVEPSKGVRTPTPRSHGTTL